MEIIITVDEFETLSNFIYRKTGIKFEPKKIYYVSKRIEKRMDILNIKTVTEYIKYIRFSDSKGIEFQNLIEILTVNETYFFRDFPQLESFAEYCLEDVAQKKILKKDKKIRIWSAACSTGEEPYTIAIILKEMLDWSHSWQIEITASDIDTVVLEKAKKGFYTSRSLREVPNEYLKKYFKESVLGWSVTEEIKQMVVFQNMNLHNREEIRKNKGFDFIFCRNLLIYFDDISRKQLVDQFYLALNIGGYIFLGSSESLGRISSAFKLKRAGQFLVYYK